MRDSLKPVLAQVLALGRAIESRSRGSRDIQEYLKVAGVRPKHPNIHGRSCCARGAVE
jgi:hypothetical protein